MKGSTRMKAAKRAELLKILRKARKFGEEYAKSEKFSEDLGGLCGFCATYTQMLAEEAGIETRIANAIGHAYVQYFEGETEYILDVTATQFSYELKRAKFPVRKIIFQKAKTLPNSCLKTFWSCKQSYTLSTIYKSEWLFHYPRMIQQYLEKCGDKLL